MHVVSTRQRGRRDGEWNHTESCEQVPDCQVSTQVVGRLFAQTGVFQVQAYDYRVLRCNQH